MWFAYLDIIVKLETNLDNKINTHGSRQRVHHFIRPHQLFLSSENCAKIPLRGSISCFDIASALCTYRYAYQVATRACLEHSIFNQCR